MSKRRTVGLLGAIGAAAGAVALGRGIADRAKALAPVPPELRQPMLFLPLRLSGPLVSALRWIPARPGPVVDGVELTERVAPGRDGHPDVGLYLYQGAARQAPTGALLWIHGGGFVIGDPVSYHELCSRFARDLGILVVSVDYRLAPEHPFPAGLEDCYTALAWLHEHAQELGVDADRVAVGGDSAGGGLTAALAQLAHDCGHTPVCFQLLVYPMLDDRTVLRADHGGTGTFIWTPGSNRWAWTAYLGHPPRSTESRPYAAAARRPDLAGLPPAWLGVGDLDLFLAEDLEYARRLNEAGVPCELHVETGMYHGADALREVHSAQARAFRGRMVEALRPRVGVPVGAKPSVSTGPPAG